MQILALAGGRLLDVAAAALRRGGVGGRCPRVDKLQLQQSAGRRDRRNHALSLSEPDLDSDSDAIVDLAWIHVGGYPLAVAEAEDRPASYRFVAWVRFEVGVLDRADDHVFDVGERDQARPVRIGGRIDGKSGGAEGAGFGLASLQAAVHPVDSDCGPA